jgi:hypothetical protein
VSFFSYSQTAIRGQVIDSMQQPIPYAIVTLSVQPSENQMLGYATTQENGSFTIPLKSYTKDTLYLSVRHMSFAKRELILTDWSEKIIISLKNQENQLQEILVNAKKNIEIKGDTMRYSVDGLKKEKDYTIEEVIDRIPGVTISENGQIKYKDKAISHLYINGVDLLEGRYNIATRGIPADAVEDIEVMQRHNHARIDIGKTESDDVAFNLKIKKDHSLVFGTARGDAGAPLITARGEITPIYLKDKVQNIASLRANNIGKTLKNYGTSLTRGNYEINALQLSDTKIIRPPFVEGNTISDKYWLDNESVSVTNDALFKTDKQVIYKASIDYNFEDSSINKDYNSVFYFDNDSTLIDRSSFNRLIQNRYQAGIVAEVNKDQLFLKNKLTLLGMDKEGLTANSQNGQDINTRYDNQERGLKNILELKNNLGEKLISSGLILEYMDSQENLAILPAVFPDVITGLTPTETFQDIDLQKFNVGAYSNMDFDLLKTKWSLKQDLNYSQENLQSQLYQDNVNNLQEFPFSSDFSLDRLSATTSLRSKYRWKRWAVTINPEMQFLQLQRTQELNNSNDSDTYAFFKPNVGLNYNYQNTWNMGINLSRDLNTSNFDNLFDGILLRDFTSLSRNPNDVNVTRSNRGGFFIGYNDILKGLFIKNNSSYNTSTSDFTFTSSLDEDGLIQVDAIRRENNATSFSNSTSLTKRFFTYLATELRYTYRNFQTQQIFNGQLQENSNNSHSLDLELGWDTSSWYALEYKGSINYGVSNNNDFRASSLFQKHDLTVDFYLSSKTRWNIAAESAISSFSSNDNVNQNTLFNTSFYYKPSKKLFLRASFDNIFNEDFFSTANNGANFINQSRFSLRPRQFTVGFNYTL